MGKDLYEKYIPDFELMAELAEILKNKRLEQGYLNLDIPESKIEKAYKKAKPKILNKHARKWGILTTYIITILIIVIIINFIVPVLGESINELISNIQLYYTKIERFH